MNKPGERTPMELMAERVREAILAAAFIQEGLHDFGYEAFLAYTDTNGAVEKVEAAISMAEIIGCAVVFAMENDMMDGVFHYEVSSAYGYSYAEKAVREGRALSRSEEEDFLRTHLLTYFMNCEASDVYALFLHCGLAKENDDE